MDAQSLAVSVVVSCCFAYAAWTLMPQVARRVLANGLLRLPLPQPLVSTLQRVTSISAGCQCSGCDRAPPKVSQTNEGAKVSSLSPQVMMFHPRKRQ